MVKEGSQNHAHAGVKEAQLWALGNLAASSSGGAQQRVRLRMHAGHRLRSARCVPTHLRRAGSSSRQEPRLLDLELFRLEFVF